MSSKFILYKNERTRWRRCSSKNSCGDKDIGAILTSKFNASLRWVREKNVSNHRTIRLQESGYCGLEHTRWHLASRFRYDSDKLNNNLTKAERESGDAILESVCFK